MTDLAKSSISFTLDFLFYFLKILKEMFPSLYFFLWGIALIVHSFYLRSLFHFFIKLVLLAYSLDLENFSDDQSHWFVFAFLIKVGEKRHNILDGVSSE